MRALCAAFVLASLVTTAAHALGQQDLCKKAMNDRIQTCADDCTRRALAAASDYKDTNNNVKFGCIKGCAIRQIFQMQVCSGGKGAAPEDPTETNR